MYYDWNMVANKAKIARLLMWLGPLVSLAVSPSTNLDPINLIKILILSTFAFGILGLFTKRDFRYLIENKLIMSSLIFFILALLFPVFLSGAPLDQQLWGTWGRNTGLLTYLSLLFICVSALLVQNFSAYKSISDSLILCGIPMSGYCLIQIAKLDPVSWSLHQTFGTLGNINFLSAFLGLVIVAQFCVLIDSSRKNSLRIFFGIKIIIDLLIIISTNSIQGILIAAAGVGVTILILFKKVNQFEKLFLPFLLISIGTFILTLMGLFNRGVLAKFIYQPSVLYRADYMHAGLEMTLKRPLFGVGLDSYGDWYRSVRGQISTLRTGPDRISNSAHNIFLDISSGGGFTLLAAYLLILLIALISAIKFIKKSQKLDYVFVSVFSCWIAYVIQALVSINQVGVGIWGWLFTGVIIGYPLTSGADKVAHKNNKVRKSIAKTIVSPGTGIRAFILSLVGFSLAFIPFTADSKFRGAMNSRNIQNIVRSLNSPGISAFHLENALQTFIQNNAVKESSDIAHKLVSKYPMDFYGWKMIALLNSTPESEKQSAIKKLKELDPYNPDIG